MKWVSKICCCLIIMSLLFTLTAVPIYGDVPFDINARSAILIDYSTGEILYEKNIHEALPPASVTKIMTMLLVMEALETKRIKLDDKVVVSEYASSMGGTQLYLEAGEVKTIEELMKGVAIRSANDATVAIGEHIAGSEEAFVKMMNNRAKELGMKNTNFVNSNGLPAAGHVTSAYDVALMSRELLRHKDVKIWLTTWMDTVVVGRRQSPQELVNTNRLVRFYEGITGVKTGSTSEAKYCLSASATRGNNSFIAVIMAAPSSQIRFNEATKLLDYAFANYNTVDVAIKDAAIGTVMVQKGKDREIEAVAKDNLSVLVKKGEEGRVKKEVVLPQYIIAPMAKGEKIGEVIVTVDGKEVGRVDVVTANDIERASVFNMLGRIFRRFIGN